MHAFHVIVAAVACVNIRDTQVGFSSPAAWRFIMAHSVIYPVRVQAVHASIGPGFVREPAPDALGIRR